MASSPIPNKAAMAAHRYGRLQEQIEAAEHAGVLLFSPMNVRYATDTVYAAITNMHSPSRAVFVPREGLAVLYESAEPRLEEIPAHIREIRDSPVTAYYVAGDAYSDRLSGWANEIAELVGRSGSSRRIAIDTAEPEFVSALVSAGLEAVNAERIVERAGAIKSVDELECIVASVEAAERGLRRMREHLEPGVTEQQLWAHLAYENAVSGGEWFEYKILVSGERTHPWGRECSDKVIQPGELVGIDTGMIGPGGYGADVSRTFHCGPTDPTQEQRRLYTAAHLNLEHNRNLIRAGMSFREFADKAWPVPDEFWTCRYNSVAHGVGMGNEWPHIPFAPDWTKNDPRDGIFEENMVMAIESCIGREDGQECVKLEDMVVIKDGTSERLSAFPFEDHLLA